MSDFYSIRRFFESNENDKFAQTVEKLVVEDLGKKNFGEVLKSMKANGEDGYIGMMVSGGDVGFALGFLYGGMFEVTDLRVSTMLQSLKKRLINEGVLNFLPKNK